MRTYQNPSAVAPVRTFLSDSLPGLASISGITKAQVRTLAFQPARARISEIHSHRESIPPSLIPSATERVSGYHRDSLLGFLIPSDRDITSDSHRTRACHKDGRHLTDNLSIKASANRSAIPMGSARAAAGPAASLQMRHIPLRQQIPGVGITVHQNQQAGQKALRVHNQEAFQ